VLGLAAPDLVDIVESGEADTARAESALQPLVERVLQWGADTLVLGCTHYPLLLPSLGRVIGERQLQVLDSAATTAERVARILDVNRLCNQGEGAGEMELLVTDAPERFVTASARLFAQPAPAPRQVVIDAPIAPLAVAG
jgi:glutamate racemase